MPLTKQENFDKLEEFISQEDASQIAAQIITCPDINPAIVGTICELSKNHAKSIFIPTADMVIDSHGLIYGAFVFGAANYVAHAAINKEFSILISSKSSFYAPLKYGEILQLEAEALFDDTSKKREVRVSGKVNDIKVFESSMSIVVTTEHVFNLKRPDATKTSEIGAKKVVTDEDRLINSLNAG